MCWRPQASASRSYRAGSRVSSSRAPKFAAQLCGLWNIDHPKVLLEMPPDVRNQHGNNCSY